MLRICSIDLDAQSFQSEQAPLKASSNAHANCQYTARLTTSQSMSKTWALLGNLVSLHGALRCMVHGTR